MAGEFSSTSRLSLFSILSIAHEVLKNHPLCSGWVLVEIAETPTEVFLNLRCRKIVGIKVLCLIVKFNLHT